MTGRPGPGGVLAAASRRRRVPCRGRGRCNLRRGVGAARHGGYGVRGGRRARPADLSPPSSARTARSMHRLAALRSSRPAVEEPVRPATLSEATSRTLAVRDASLGWSGPPVVSGLDIQLPPGRRLGVVGPSGSGKSTLAAALLRFVDPSEGVVELDQRDLRQLRSLDVRRSVALVDDDPHIFNSTLAENVRFAHPEATDVEAQSALNRAHLSSRSRALPGGLATLLGDGGLPSPAASARVSRSSLTGARTWHTSTRSSTLPATSTSPGIVPAFRHAWRPHDSHRPWQTTPRRPALIEGQPGRSCRGATSGWKVWPQAASLRTSDPVERGAHVVSWKRQSAARREHGQHSRPTRRFL